MEVQDKKKRILEATLKLITDRGFHGTPVSMIAEEADVGAGTIYRYFKNKEAIINELYDIIQKNLHEATVRDVPDDISVRDEFYVKWRHILEYFLDNRDEANFIIQYSASPYISRTVKEENDRRNAHLRALIDRGLRNKEIRAVDYNTIAIYMWGTIKQMHHLYINDSIQITEELIADIYSVFWEGIRMHPEG